MKDEALIRRGMKTLRLDEPAAVKLPEVRLEPEYCRYSRQAIAKLLPLLSRGVSLQTAIKELYPEQFSKEGEPLDRLPPVESEEMPDLRNPVVERTLTELRRIVNALIKQYGKPDRIRIELGRDLRQHRRSEPPCGVRLARARSRNPQGGSDLQVYSMAA